MRTDWGIKKPKYFLFKIYFLRKSLRVTLRQPTSLYKDGKSLRLALTRPTSILREARRREKWMVKSKIGKHFLCLPIYGWGGRIWTYECSSQSAVSYRLTTPQYLLFLNYTLINVNLQEKYLADLESGVDSRIRTDGLQCHKLAL